MLHLFYLRKIVIFVDFRPGNFTTSSLFFTDFSLALIENGVDFSLRICVTVGDMVAVVAEGPSKHGRNLG